MRNAPGCFCFSNDEKNLKGIMLVIGLYAQIMATMEINDHRGFTKTQNKIKSINNSKK